MTDKLPEINGWQIKSIQDISDVTGGSTPSTNEPAYWEGDIPFVTPTDITSLKNSNYIEKTRRYITEKGLHAISSDLLEPGTILLTSRATLGEVAINKVPLVTNQGFANFKPHSDINGLWLLHYLRAQKRELERLSSGSTFKEISKKSIKRMKIPVPPLGEQRGIVEVLGTVDGCIRLTDAVIERAEELKRGLMQQLLTRGIGHTEYKESPLGKTPVNWDLLHIEDISKVKGGKRLPKGHKFVEGTSNYPYIRVIDLKNGKVDTNNLKYLSQKTYEIIKRYIINQDDVYISIAGTIGLCGTIPKILDGANLTENAAKITNIKKVIPNYLSYYLISSLGQKQIESLTGKTSQPKLALFRINKILVPIPPYDEQNSILEILTFIDKKIDIENIRKTHFLLFKQGFMQQLLTGKIRVELRDDGLHRIGDGRETHN